jgi:hypothetical protein
LGQLQALNSGDFSSFKESPAYGWQVQQGNLALQNGATRNGNLWGGGTDSDRISFGQGLASQEYGNFYNRIASMAGVGQTAAQNLAGLGQNYAQMNGNAYQNQANASRESIYGQANAWGNAIGGLANVAGTYFGQRQQPQQQGYGAFAPQQGYGGYGTLGPSNGSSWNFGA